MVQPTHIFNHQYVQRALMFCDFNQRNEITEISSRRDEPELIFTIQNRYRTFLDLVFDPQTPFLMECFLEPHFGEIRKGVLRAMNIFYMQRSNGAKAEDIKQVLNYDTLKQCIQTDLYYGVAIGMSQAQVLTIFEQKNTEANAPVLF